MSFQNGCHHRLLTRTTFSVEFCLIRGHLRKWHGVNTIIFGQDFKVHPLCATLQDSEHEINAFCFTNFPRRIRRFQLPFWKWHEKMPSFSCYNTTETSSNTTNRCLIYLLLYLCPLTCYKAKLFTKIALENCSDLIFGRFRPHLNLPYREVWAMKTWRCAQAGAQWELTYTNETKLSGQGTVW